MTRIPGNNGLSIRDRRPPVVGVVALTSALLVACTGSPGASPGPSASWSRVSPAPVDPTTSDVVTTTGTASPPDEDTVAPPRELVGEWSASTAETGKLELTIDEGGAFHHHDGQLLDDRGTVSVRGGQLDFHYSDGSVDSFGWSLRGGTLVLDGITYLRTSGTGGAQALAGEWIGYDDVFETLVFGLDGGFTRRHEQTGSASGTFTVEGDELTITLAGEDPTTVTWSVEDATLTLVDSSDTARQYARLS